MTNYNHFHEANKLNINPCQNQDVWQDEVCLFCKRKFPKLNRVNEYGKHTSVVIVIVGNWFEVFKNGADMWV